MPTATLILQQIENGDPAAVDELLPLVYDELRRLAAQRLGNEKPGQTLQATALVHEVYIRLVDNERAQHWDSRGHFFAAAAEAMRRILVENARRKKSAKCGGGGKRVNLREAMVSTGQPADDLLALDEAIDRLEEKDPQVANLVKLRYFSGMTVSEVAEILGITSRTADNYWAFAKAWLLDELERA